MRKNILGLAAAAVLVVIPARGRAQVHVGIDIGIAFPEPPPLVVVSPGIQIVPEYEEEVYFTNGWYWVRRDDAWYRTRDYRGHWVPVRSVYVPPPLVRIPPGRYRHYYRDDDGMWRPHRDADWHAWHDRHPWEERRDWWRQHRYDHEVRREQDRSWREHDRAWKEQEHAERDRRHAEEKRERHDDHGWRGEPQPARADDRRGPPPAPVRRGGEPAPAHGHGHDDDRGRDKDHR